mmetsp:Transcript_15011/g.38571  ORF Transcript_15011/g.38571 Transcript_15011/m.38571 type:complete len:257 (+) Transcript_15011:1016-1786(+)
MGWEHEVCKVCVSPRAVKSVLAPKLFPFAVTVTVCRPPEKIPNATVLSSALKVADDSPCDPAHWNVNSWRRAFEPIPMPPETGLSSEAHRSHSPGGLTTPPVQSASVRPSSVEKPMTTRAPGMLPANWIPRPTNIGCEHDVWRVAVVSPTVKSVLAENSPELAAKVTVWKLSAVTPRVTVESSADTWLVSNVEADVEPSGTHLNVSEVSLVLARPLVSWSPQMAQLTLSPEHVSCTTRVWPSLWQMLRLMFKRNGG